MLPGIRSGGISEIFFGEKLFGAARRLIAMANEKIFQKLPLKIKLKEKNHPAAANEENKSDRKESFCC